MHKSYISLISALLLMLSAGCREDVPFVPDEAVRGERLPVEFNIDIAGSALTRGILGESKQAFESGDLIHLCVVYECIDKNNQPRTENVYAMLQYSDEIRLGEEHHKGTWSTPAGGTVLRWPDDARKASFTACYIDGSNGSLSENVTEVKLLSDYKPSEVPLYAEVKDVEYGRAVNLRMERLFAHLTLTDIQEGISDYMWFTTPDDSFSNAFKLQFDSENCKMIPTFIRVPDNNYKDSNGNQLVYVKSYAKDNAAVDDEESVEEGTTPGYCFFLEPGEYHQFSIRYPRSNSESSVYLTYTGDLSKVKRNDDGDEVGPFKRNGRYVFSILKSLGIEVLESPDDGWDERDPAYDIDVEAFLRAVQSGADYRVQDSDGQWVDILESTIEGTRLLQNVSFKNTYYDVFASGFEPTLALLFDGNYHYIYDMACPLFYRNNGTITNLGLRKVKTARDHPIISCEKMLCADDNVHDRSRNGIIAMHNTTSGTVNNIRVIDVDIMVKIQTSNLESPTQEAHNVGILFGSNEGLVTNIGLAGNLRLTVENADGETIMPRVMIGGAAGQNLGTIRGITDIETTEGSNDEEFDEPNVYIVNNCKGTNGVYMAGGIAGNNTGSIENVLLPELTLDMSPSAGIESNLGGIVGQCPESSVAPKIKGCIVRGKVVAGEVRSLVGILSHSYAGGVAGWINVQTEVDNCSVAVSVKGTPNDDSEVEYGQGGAFGVLTQKDGYPEGSIQMLSCYGEELVGYNRYTGNFAGIVPGGFNWDHYTGRQINMKRHGETPYVGHEREN